MRKLIIMLAMFFFVVAGAEAQTATQPIVPVLKLDGAPLPNATIVKFVASRETMEAKHRITIAFNAMAFSDEKLEGRFFKGLSSRVSVDLTDRHGSPVRSYGTFNCFLSNVEWGSSVALATWTLNCSANEKP